jgi:hypothetical protein
MYAPPALAEEESTPPALEQGVADIVGDAIRLYRMHARALLLTCVFLFVPASLVKSCAMAAILAPVRAADSTAAVVDSARAADATRRALADAYQRHADPETITLLQRAHQRQLEDMSRHVAEVTRDRPGGLTLFVLGLLGAIVSAFLYGFVVPLTSAALTVAVADRLGGGRAGWLEVWMLVFGRLRELLSAIVPAALLVAGGLILWVLPGMIVAFLFVFVPPVVLIERLAGKAALARSVALVRADWLRVALLVAAFIAVAWAARVLADLLIPDSALFLTQLIGDLATLALMPIPILGLVLLYLDIRRRDGFTPEDLRTELAALRD